MISSTHTVRGPLSYAKVFGDPMYNKYKDAREWKFDIQIDKDTVKELKSQGLGVKVKQKDEYLDGNPYLTFTQAEFRKDKVTGAPVANKPPKVTDILGKDWNPEMLLGNGTVADVKFKAIKYGSGIAPGLYVQEIRVLDHSPYAASGFSKIDESDPYYIKAQEAAAVAAMATTSTTTTKTKDTFKKDFGLDDSVSDIGTEEVL